MSSSSRPRYLFVYGTLRPGHAPPTIAAQVRRLREIGPATVRGRVVDLGEYPGALPDDSAATTIDGTVLHLGTEASALKALDAYEGFDPADPAGSLFLRTPTTATLSDGRRLACWIYVWNRLPRGPVSPRGRARSSSRAPSRRGARSR